MGKRGVVWPALAAAGLLTACHGGVPAIPSAAGAAASGFDSADAVKKNVTMTVTVPLPSKAAGLAGLVFGQGFHSDPAASFSGNVGPKGRCTSKASERVCTVAARIPPGGPFDLVVTLYDRYPVGGKVVGTATVVLDLRDKKVHHLDFATSGAIAGARVALNAPSLHAIDPASIYATVSALDSHGNVLIVDRYTKSGGAAAQIALSSSVPKNVLVFKPRILKKPSAKDVVVTYLAQNASTALVHDGATVTVDAKVNASGAKTATTTLAVLKPGVTNATLKTGGAQPGAIAAGPDGALWFCENGAGKVGRITTAMSVTGEYGSFDHPQSIASAGGALWIAENGGAGNIDSIATDGTVTVYPLATNTYPNGISAGPGSQLWFGSNNFNYVATVSTSGTYGPTYALPNANSYPDHSVLGPDGNQYFTLNGTGQVAKVAQSGTILATFGEPGTLQSPEDIVAGPDGQLWFADDNQSVIYSMTTTGAFKAFAISKAVGVAGPLAFGPDGKLWFAAQNGAGRLDTTAGTVTSFALVEGGGPFGIALGPDGALYFTENVTGQISRLQ